MRAHLILILSLFLIYPTLSAAQVFKYVDKNGAVAFTDNLENVPEEQRPKIQQAAPAPLQQFEMPISSRGSGRWIDHPLSKYIIAFIALSIFMLYIQSRTDRFLLKLVTKLLFVAFLGAAIYSVMAMQDKAITPAGLQKAAEPYLPSAQPLNDARKAVSKVEEAQKKQEEAIEELMKGLPTR